MMPVVELLCSKQLSYSNTYEIFKKRKGIDKILVKNSKTSYILVSPHISESCLRYPFVFCYPPFSISKHFGVTIIQRPFI